MATETIRISGEGLTISVLVWRRYRRLRPGLVERILTLNPGVASQGMFLPVGTSLVLPVETRKVTTDQTAIALWD
jgi:phage tail protein X